MARDPAAYHEPPLIQSLTLHCTRFTVSVSKAAVLFIYEAGLWWRMKRVDQTFSFQMDTGLAGGSTAPTHRILPPQHMLIEINTRLLKQNLTEGSDSRLQLMEPSDPTVAATTDDGMAFIRSIAIHPAQHGPSDR